MKEYKNPKVIVVDEYAEGVYAASGDRKKCSHGRTEASPGSDTCQWCSYADDHGIIYDAARAMSGITYDDYTHCVENMPQKAY